MTATGENTGVDQRAIDVGGEFQQAAADPGPLDIRALAVAAATAAGRYDPAEQTPDDALKACEVMDGLVEKIEQLSIDDGGSPGEGTTVNFVDGFFDENGERVATVTGTGTVLTMTPHMWQVHRSRAELDDGTFEITGLLDVGALLRSMTQVLRIVGTGGRYAGKTGYLTLTVLDPTQRPPHYSTMFALC